MPANTNSQHGNTQSNIHGNTHGNTVHVSQDAHNDGEYNARNLHTTDLSTGLSPVELPEVRVRFNTTLRVSDLDLFVRALIASANDVPVLLAEVERLRRAYADLVAACRAGLLAEADAVGEEDRMAAWGFVTDELPAPAPGHPLHDTHHYPAYAVAGGADRGEAGGADTRYAATRPAEAVTNPVPDLSSVMGSGMDWDQWPGVDPVIYPGGGGAYE